MNIFEWIASFFNKESPKEGNQSSGPIKIQEVTFPQQAESTLDGVKFPAIVDGEKRVCSVTTEALQDHFGLRDDDYVGTFQMNRGRILIVAEQLIRSGQFSENEDIIVKSSDL